MAGGRERIDYIWGITGLKCGESGASRRVGLALDETIKCQRRNEVNTPGLHSWLCIWGDRAGVGLPSNHAMSAQPE